jgi:hypothetical protein
MWRSGLIPLRGDPGRGRRERLRTIVKQHPHKNPYTPPLSGALPVRCDCRGATDPELRSIVDPRSASPYY